MALPGRVEGSDRPWGLCIFPPQTFCVPCSWVSTLTFRLLWVSPCGIRESGRATRGHSDNGEKGTNLATPEAAGLVISRRLQSAYIHWDEVMF